MKGVFVSLATVAFRSPRTILNKLEKMQPKKPKEEARGGYR